MLKVVIAGVIIDIICGSAILQQLKLQIESQCCASSSIAGEALQGASEDNMHTTVITNTSSFFI